MSAKFLTIETNVVSHSEYSLQLNRWFLKPIGAWPASSETTTVERISSIILIIVCYNLSLLTLIPFVLYWLLEEKNPVVKIKLAGPIVHWIVGSVNYTVLLLRGKDIRDCITHIKTDWRLITSEKDQEVMLKNAKFGRYIAASCAAFMQGGVLCFCFLAALNTEEIQAGNETRSVHQIPCAVYTKLMDVNESPTNEIVLVVQCLSAFIVNSSTVGIFSLAAVLGSHACGQLSVVMLWITEFVNESKGQGRMAPFKQMGMIVEQHLRALSFIANIEEIMNRICFLELGRCTLHICLLGYHIVTEWAEHDIENMFIYFTLLCSTCFNIFIICYIGDILTEQCRRVGEAVYMSNWYYLPDKIIFDLIFIISRSNSAIKITAGKLVHMSIYTFADVLKTAFAYLNLLRQVT